MGHETRDRTAMCPTMTDPALAQLLGEDFSPAVQIRPARIEPLAVHGLAQQPGIRLIQLEVVEPEADRIGSEMESGRGTRYVVRWRKEIIAAAMPRRGGLPSAGRWKVRPAVLSTSGQIVATRASSPGDALWR